jgi:hypothetical protein
MSRRRPAVAGLWRGRQMFAKANQKSEVRGPAFSKLTGWAGRGQRRLRFNRLSRFNDLTVQRITWLLPACS